MTLALGVTLTIKAKRLGIGPWDVFHYGLFKQLGLTIGTWSIIAGFVVLGISYLLNRKLPQLGTVANMVLIGLFIDFFYFLLPAPTHIVSQVIVFLTGIIILAYGIGLYIAANVGAGPRDSLMLAICEKTNWSVSIVRGGMEITVLILGWLLDGPVGFGTVLIALSLGPIVEISLRQSKQLVNFIVKRGEVNENLN
ncbi:hypothetical protein CIB95_05485 [Lottiidibacillus patelloidae]|uniref:YitT family protein n=1 Tax=Lottiidibacillus patelloidae TaxID=2670334 RepID=A0A263BWQ6_9BACI|nr:YitT family protein [Lottiidibacillus patelloidae]OZM58008.1 hypothetical protein CIB95_05485 [Lottiidibacillus patelloidae]